MCATIPMLQTPIMTARFNRTGAEKHRVADIISHKHLATELLEPPPHVTVPPTDEAFKYCCYILESSDYKRTYVGVTNNLKRRLRQHNGEICGGAKSTSLPQMRPWKVVLTITGFRTHNEALMFEWSLHHVSRINTKKGSRAILTRFLKLKTVLRKHKWTSRSPPAHEVPLTLCFDTHALMIEFTSGINTQTFTTKITLMVRPADADTCLEDDSSAALVSLTSTLADNSSINN